jgi:hypothetical protein
MLIFAHVRTAALEATVRLLNLSSRGAMIVGPIDLVPGHIVSLDIRNYGWVSGRVAWAKPGRCGVVFDGPIDAQAARTPP